MSEPPLPDAQVPGAQVPGASLSDARVPDAPLPDALARSPIAPAPPVVVTAGWEVSGRRATAALTITDCTPLAKVQLRAPAGGSAAAGLGVPFGRAARDGDGTLVVGSGPGEWLLIGPPGHGSALAGGLARRAERAPGESVTWVDLTHGRALMRLNGSSAPVVLGKVCGVDLSEDITPDGAAFRSSVAALATDVIRDDAGASLGDTAGARADGTAGASADGTAGASADGTAGASADGTAGASADGTAGTRSYLLHCERSSGQYLFDALLRAGREFGIEIDGFTTPGI